MEGRGGIDAMGVKDAGLDATSALELIVAVAKTEQVRHRWMHGYPFIIEYEDTDVLIDPHHQHIIISTSSSSSSSSYML